MKKMYCYQLVCFIFVLIIVSPYVLANQDQQVFSFQNPSFDLALDLEEQIDMEYESDFILPEWGGAMVHSTPQLTDYINLPISKDDVSIKWWKNELAGEQAGAKGNGITSNGNIAACTFGSVEELIMEYYLGHDPYPGEDNLVIYDYNGNYIWQSDNLLNNWAFVSAPMVDIHNRVIACDNKSILMVDPLDYDNDGVIVEWISDLPYGGIPLSPVIVENKTIVLATKGGPIYAYDVADGSLLATKYLEIDENETSNPFYEIDGIGNETLLSAEMTDLYDCDEQFETDVIDQVIDLILDTPYGEIPSRQIVIDNETIDPYYKISDSDTNGSFTTINSPCVRGNRIYISTEYETDEKPLQRLHDILDPFGVIPTISYHSSRLYAIDVNSDSDDVFSVVWYYKFGGMGQAGQASPTIIGDNIYFDSWYNWYGADPRLLRDPHIYAITDNGDDFTLKWSIPYDYATWFTFSMDPRGGFWYIDSTLFGNRSLVHFSEDDGSKIEEIVIDDLIGGNNYFPVSVMTICGNETNPIMLVGAEKFGIISYVLAIDLEDSNSLLWKVKIDSISDSLPPVNLADGQYTILIEDNKPLILFGSYWDGVMAIGSDIDDDQNLDKQMTQEIFLPGCSQDLCLLTR